MDYFGNVKILIFKAYFNIYTALNVMKLTNVIQMYKSMFRIQGPEKISVM